MSKRCCGDTACIAGDRLPSSSSALGLLILSSSSRRVRAGCRAPEPPARAAKSAVDDRRPVRAVSASTAETATDQTHIASRRPAGSHFGYALCRRQPPGRLLPRQIGTALKELGPDAAKVEPRSRLHSRIPQRDTPKVMQQHTQWFDPRIIGLVGIPATARCSPPEEYGAD